MYQKVIIVGHLGIEPELRFTASGDAVTSMSVATNRKWTNSDGQKQEQVTWFRVSVWGKQAEVCNDHLAKGRQVLVEGSLTPDPATGGPRIWEDSEGNARASFELRAIRVQFLGGGGQSQSEETQSRPSGALAEDEIPF